MKVEHGVPIPTPGHILTFALPHPPATIRAGYLSLQAASVPVQPKPCSSGSALEGMVRELPQQVAALVQQLSAKTFPRSGGTDISELAPSVPVRPAKPTQPKGRDTLSKQQSTEG
ncbi:hypothetical protein J6590_091510 [Homalodisca vitripennis]|nr:hypothetical protein J6590_091510 [Homalodisca vitripennis]